MSEPGAELAERFERAVDEAIAVIAAVPDERWTTRTGGEGWTVAVVARHIARAIAPELSLIEAVAQGKPVPPAYRDWAIIHRSNADNLALTEPCSRAEVIALLDEGRADALTALRRLDAEQLDRSAIVPIVTDDPVTARQLIGWILIGHIRGHLAGIRAVVEGDAAGIASDSRP